MCSQNLLNDLYHDTSRHCISPGESIRPSPASPPYHVWLQGLLQQQQYEQQLQQLTLRRLSPLQMQQLHDLPVEQRAMHFGHYMRQTQLHLQQHQMQQQHQVSLIPALLFGKSKPHDQCISTFAAEPSMTASLKEAL